ncbi:hypothetical protein ACUXV3_06850 [Roseobacteraceae bacterium NS-SX3]
MTLPLPVLWFLIAADAACLVWQFRQFLRAGDAHVQGTGALAPVWGGYLVLLFAGFATLTLWWDAVLLAHRPVETESFSQRMERERAALYSLTLAEGGTALQLEGEITYGLTARLRQQIAAAPKLEVIELESPGGNIFEARGAARVVRMSGLATRATGDCTSACTLIFAAGKSRSLAVGARLGFHSYALAFHSRLPQFDVADQQEKDRAFFVAQGVNAAFAARLFEARSTDMWYPETAELRAAGLLTE